MNMNIDDITPQLIEQTLRAWRYQDDPPEAILDFQFLMPRGTSRSERMQAFHSFILEYVTGELARWRDFCSVENREPANRTELEDQIRRDFKQQHKSLEIWSALYHRYILENHEVQELENLTGQDDTRFRRLVKSGIRKLTEAIQKEEQNAQALMQQAMVHAQIQEPYDQRPVGIDEIRKTICGHLKEPHGPSLFCIEGLGGIGKSTLARSVIEQLAKEKAFDHIVWLSAKREYFNATDAKISPLDYEPMTQVQELLDQLLGKFNLESPQKIDEKTVLLSHFLSQRRCLIVLDNFENLEDVEEVLPYINRMAGHSRFLITSRVSLGRFPGIEVHSLKPLGFSHTFQLLRMEYQRLKGREMPAMEYFARRIHEVVGGIPLVLKLLAAQMSMREPEVCIQWLEQAYRSAGLSKENGHVAEQDPTLNDRYQVMFDYIYRQTWNLLSAEGRTLLLSIFGRMPPEGLNITWLRALTPMLSSAHFIDALEEIRRYALIEIDDFNRQYLYHLHPTTIIFLSQFAQPRSLTL